MKLVATLALVVALALPAAAQLVPDEFPDPAASMADRVQRELIERHRAFLSGLYATSHLGVGPGISQPGVVGSVQSEAGYRFRTGHAVALGTSFRMPLGRSPVSGVPETGFAASLQAEVVLPLGGRADRHSVLRGAEVALGLGASAFEGRDGLIAVAPTVSVHPRVAFPLTAVTSVPVGLRVSQEVGPSAVRGPYVGVTVGLRRIWADAARMVLE